jgi:regulator of protease activity HflC (stomatin/prohibitin superfamily)
MEVYTRDTLLLEVDAVMYYRIADVHKANYEVDDLQGALLAAAQTQIKEAFGQMTFHEALECQGFINEYLVREFGMLFEKWGVQVFRMELVSLVPARADRATTEAMKLQMIAERNRRGEFIRSEGVKASRNIRADGSKRVAQILGIAEQEATKKLSEGSAASTVILAQAEQNSLDAIAQVTLRENTTLSEFFLTKQYIEFFGTIIRSKRGNKITLPFEPNMFGGSLFKSVAQVFGRNGGKQKSKGGLKPKYADLD